MKSYLTVLCDYVKHYNIFVLDDHDYDLMDCHVECP